MLSRITNAKSHFEVLGLEPGADEALIHDTYNSLKRLVHPDVNAKALKSNIPARRRYCDFRSSQGGTCNLPGWTVRSDRSCTAQHSTALSSAI